MLSDDIRSLRKMVDDHTAENGSLVLTPMLTQILKISFLDLSKRAASMEASRIAGPAMITDADITSGKVERLPVVPRPVPAAPDGGGSAA